MLQGFLELLGVSFIGEGAAWGYCGLSEAFHVRFFLTFEGA